ncbi:hypothetical protein EYF80_055774 [Liparis tanakae]|uniref:Uncharacterized protein n=1 Tax=Liparis tanakae TaxID=230148 RepID=A0A4Z2EYJ8_9TELE|nr:hypothetical protein EYF80_055774 [Liparis tanakae]
MWNTSAILLYSSLTLVNPWMRPVGLPWASWVWKTSRGLGYSGGPGGGGEGGGGRGGATPVSEAPVPRGLGPRVLRARGLPGLHRAPASVRPPLGALALLWRGEETRSAPRPADRPPDHTAARRLGARSG